MPLSQHVEEARSQAVADYLSDGVLLPRLCSLRGDEIVSTHVILHDTNQGKQEMYQRVIADAKREGVDGFIDVFEAWVGKDLQLGQRPSESPNRSEGVMIIGRQIVSGKRETLARIYRIVRPGIGVDLVLDSASQPRDVDEIKAWFDPYLDNLLASN